MSTDLPILATLCHAVSRAVLFLAGKPRIKIRTCCWKRLLKKVVEWTFWPRAWVGVGGTEFQPPSTSPVIHWKLLWLLAPYHYPTHVMFAVWKCVGATWASWKWRHPALVGVERGGALRQFFTHHHYYLWAQQLPIYNAAAHLEPTELFQIFVKYQIWCFKTEEEQLGYVKIPPLELHFAIICVFVCVCVCVCVWQP